MIDFKDIRFTDKEELIFLPAALLNDFLYFLDCKRPDVKHKTFMLFKIKRNEKIKTARKEYVMQHQHIFDGTAYAGCPVDKYMGLLSNIDPDWLYTELRKFYYGSPEEDSEVKAWRQKNVNPVIVTESPKGDDVSIVRLDPKRFKGVGSYREMTELEGLMEDKHLSQRDIDVILSALKFKSE